MKFGKRLNVLVQDSLPDWRDKYISYKRLKKLLKCIPAHPRDSLFPHRVASSLAPSRALTAVDDRLGTADCVSGTSAASPACEVSRPGAVVGSLVADEADFIALLNADLEKMNTFFLEKEEEFVIRLQEIKGRLEAVKEAYKTSRFSNGWNEDIVKIRKDVVNAHGEMVLLENYSALNYTGLVKIVKKHDKKTGAFLRMPFIQNVLREPFFATDIVSQLVRECEANLQLLFSFPHSSAEGESDFDVETGKAGLNDEHGSEFDFRPFQGNDTESMRKSIMAAFRIMKEMRKGSSTYNVFSFPPFDQIEDDDGSFCRNSTCTINCCPEIPVCSKS